VGSFVRLSDNSVALVLRVNEATISRPVVSRVLTADAQPVAQPEELDLSAIPELVITGIVNSAETTD
jgi:hypothetical protein